MALAIAHFALGFTIVISYLIFSGFYKGIRYDFALGIFGGLWALGPDVHKIIPELRFIHDSILFANLFFFHGLLDMIDNSITEEANVVLAALLLSFMVISVVGLIYVENDGFGEVWHIEPSN